MGRKRMARLTCQTLYGKILKCNDVYAYIVTSKKRVIYGITNWYVDRSSDSTCKFYNLFVWFENSNQPDVYTITNEQSCESAICKINRKLKELGFRR